MFIVRYIPSTHWRVMNVLREMTFSLLFTENTHSTLFFVGFLLRSPSRPLAMPSTLLATYSATLLCATHIACMWNGLHSLFALICVPFKIVRVFSMVDCQKCCVLLRCCHSRYVMCVCVCVQKSENLVKFSHSCTWNVRMCYYPPIDLHQYDDIFHRKILQYERIKEISAWEPINNINVYAYTWWSSCKYYISIYNRSGGSSSSSNTNKCDDVIEWSQGFLVSRTINTQSGINAKQRKTNNKQFLVDFYCYFFFFFFFCYIFSKEDVKRYEFDTLNLNKKKIKSKYY